MKKLISISLFAVIAMMSSANTAEAQRMIRGGSPVIVTPIVVNHCRVRAHRGWRHRRAVVVARPVAIRPVRMHRYHW